MGNGVNWWDDVREKAGNWKELEMPEPRIDLDHMKLASNKEIEEERKNAERLLDNLGISNEEKNMLLGTTIQENNQMIYKAIRADLEKKGVIVEEMNKAVKRFPWLKEYFFKIFPTNENALTAYHSKNWDNGVFVYAGKNARMTAPLHAFFLLNESSFAQTPHSIIIADEGSEIHIVEGCTAPVLIKNSLHVGGTEIFVKKSAKVFLTKLQNWPKYVHTRPLTYARLEDGARLNLVNIVLGGGKTTMEHPRIDINGKNAKLDVREVIMSKDKSLVDLGTYVHHNAEDSSSQIISKTLATDNSKAVTRGIIYGHKRGSKGYFSCDSMILGENASAEAYPGLSADLSDLQLSHEASFGKIAEKEIMYLRSRGFNEEEAIELILKGFVSPALVDVPLEFRVEVEKIIELAAKGL